MCCNILSVCKQCWSGPGTKGSATSANVPFLVSNYLVFDHWPLEWSGESIDYTAWQDMNELPANIFPRIIVGRFGEGDEEDSDEEDEEQMSSEVSLICFLGYDKWRTSWNT